MESPGMSIDERLEALTQTVELLTSMHMETERLHQDNERRIGQLMDTMNRLGHIVEVHDASIDDHEQRLDKLEGRN